MVVLHVQSLIRDGKLNFSCETLDVLMDAPHFLHFRLPKTFATLYLNRTMRYESKSFWIQLFVISSLFTSNGNSYIMNLTYHTSPGTFMLIA